MTFTSVNPHDPADVLGEWEPADAAEAEAAVGRALKAARGMARHARPRPGPRRSATPPPRWSSAPGEVTALIVREVGKPVSEARGEVARGVAILRYYAQAALLPDGETLPGRRPRSAAAGPAPAGRRGRAAHAVELPGRDPAVEGRARAWPTATRRC